MLKKSAFLVSEIDAVVWHVVYYTKRKIVLVIIPGFLLATKSARCNNEHGIAR